jgi:hypothetical protein
MAHIPSLRIETSTVFDFTMTFPSRATLESSARYRRMPRCWPLATRLFSQHTPYR